MKEISEKLQPLWDNIRRGGKCFFIVLLSLLLSAIGNAALAEHEMQIDFSFDTQAMPEKEIAGYRLYKEGNLECQSGPVDPQNISCTIASITGTFAYTLSAFFTDGYESPQSTPYNFSINQSLAIKGLQVLSGQSVSGISDMGSLASGAAVDLADVIHLLRQSAQ